MRPVRTGTVKSKIKRGDQVVFVAGKEYNRYDSAGKRQPLRGKVIEVDARNGKVKVEGAMIVKRHRKAVPQMNVEGGIIEQEAWVDVSNVALIDPDTGKPTRVKIEDRNGEKVRVARSGKIIPLPQTFRTPKREKKEEEE
jgi:large subunit ribosomal protein L24